MRNESRQESHDQTLNRATGEARLTQILLTLVVFGVAGLMAELLLLKHTESLSQWIPIVALGAGLAAALGVWLVPGPWSVRVFQAVMVVFVAAGVLGIYLHLAGNVEWVRERNPSLGGMPLVWKALTGATPALAPGAMAQIGLLGLVYAWSAGRR